MPRREGAHAEEEAELTQIKGEVGANEKGAKAP